MPSTPSCASRVSSDAASSVRPAKRANALGRSAPSRSPEPAAATTAQVTVKRVDGDGAVLETLDRRALRAVQTPQGFRTEILRRALGGDRTGATDCATLVERAGGRVVVVPGDPANLKVTTPEDLARAEALYEASHDA